MGFLEATKTCFSKYATFSGRASRPEYWWFYLFVVLAGIVTRALDYAIFGGTTVVVETTPGPAAPDAAQSEPITSIFGLVVMLPLLAAGWRRAHDVGKPGWYVLLPGIAALVGLFGLLLGVAGLGLLETFGVDPERLHGLAAVMGVAGMIAVAALVLGLTIYKFVLLARPTAPETNPYGPPAAV